MDKFISFLFFVPAFICSVTNEKASTVIIMAAFVPKDSKIYQFKIVLLNKPQIWRRIEIPENYSFFDFHIAIDDAFARRNDEWHIFVISKETEVQPQLIGFMDASGLVNISERELSISEKFPLIDEDCMYSRFNDLLCFVNYSISLEQILTSLPDVKYPRCIAGELANTLEAETPGLEESGSSEILFSIEQINFRDPKVISESDESSDDDF